MANHIRNSAVQNARRPLIDNYKELAAMMRENNLETAEDIQKLVTAARSLAYRAVKFANDLDDINNDPSLAPNYYSATSATNTAS